MTPREKAEELKEKFDGYICYAEAAVDEVLNIVGVWSAFNDRKLPQHSYWQEVKQELEKL